MGARQTVAHLAEALRLRHLRAEDFQHPELAEGLIPDGHQWVRMLDPRQSPG